MLEDEATIPSNLDVFNAYVQNKFLQGPFLFSQKKEQVLPEGVLMIVGQTIFNSKNEFNESVFLRKIVALLVGKSNHSRSLAEFSSLL